MNKLLNNMIFLLIAIVPIAGFASGVVYDPWNWAQNNVTAIKSIATAQTVANSYVRQGLQFEKLKQQYEQVTNHYKLDLTDLLKLANIASLLANNNQVINTDRGDSAYALLAGLNPQDPDYAQKRDAILKKYYSKPEDPADIAQQFRGILTPEEINTMTADAQQNKNFYQRIQDVALVAAKQQQASKQRMKDITNYQKSINNLGDKSGLKTAQVTATEMNFSLQQNEAELASLRSIQQAQSEAMAEHISAKSQDFENEQKRLLKASQQKATGIGRNKWGDL